MGVNISAAKPVTTAAEFFSDQMLAHNFYAINDSFVQISQWADKVDKSLADVTKLASKKPSKLKPFVVGAVVGVAVVRYVQKNKRDIQRILDENNLKFTMRMEQAGDTVSDIADKVKAETEKYKGPGQG